MGSSREIILWLDDRWYDALSRQLKDVVEEKLNGYLDELVSQIPEQVREKISGEIREEDQKNMREMEARKRYSAFRITENGSTEHFMVERSVGMLSVAGFVRTSLRQELGPHPFREMLQGRIKILRRTLTGWPLRG